jgi:hypothetical protein
MAHRSGDGLVIAALVRRVPIESHDGADVLAEASRSTAQVKCNMHLHGSQTGMAHPGAAALHPSSQALLPLHPRNLRGRSSGLAN